jgi:hypothetical protein
MYVKRRKSQQRDVNIDKTKTKNKQTSDRRQCLPLPGDISYRLLVESTLFLILVYWE